MDKLPPREESYDEMSRSFKEAFYYSNNNAFAQSIPLYEKALEEDSNNFAALNNLGVAKVRIGLETKNKDLLNQALTHFNNAIRIVNEVYEYPEGYPLAESNLEWLQKNLSNL